MTRQSRRPPGKPSAKATRHMAPWRVLLWFKFTEMVLQCRPRAIWRVLFHRDAGLRHAMRWYTQMGRRVWPHEILAFLRDSLLRKGPTVAEFWGAPQDHQEVPLRIVRRQHEPGASPPPRTVALPQLSVV